jgi:3-oxoacyl-[acyl-carrier protein] reductase
MTQTRCAILSGGSRGLGRAIAIQLARDGFDIAFCYAADAVAADETALAITDLGRQVFHTKADVADPSQVASFVAEAEDCLGPAYAVVTCAGVVRDRALARMSRDEWTTVLGTNLDGTYHLCRSTVFGMMRRRAGAVVTVSSVAGLCGQAGQTNYSASKAGIVGLTQALAREVAPFGVRANVVAPGFIDTEMLDSLRDRERQRALDRIGMRRFGAAQHVADAVSYLVSDRAAYVTGAVLRVDGGLAG